MKADCVSKSVHAIFSTKCLFICIEVMEIELLLMFILFHVFVCQKKKVKIYFLYAEVIFI